MKNYITIDGGTTNTRASLISGGKVVDTLRLGMGARACGEDKEAYTLALRKLISDLIARNECAEGDIERILAAGSITSELGIYPLEHLTLPVSIRDLKIGMADVLLPEICAIPFSFVRGVKTAPTSLDAADMMRGEECEMAGIIRDRGEEGIYLLMGSHTKIIITDSEGNISHFHTHLTGELIEAVATNTILKSSIALNSCEIDHAFLKDGYTYSRDRGLSEALFKVRVLRNIFSATEKEAYSFFLGAMLENDVKRVLSYGIGQVIVGGNKRLKEAIFILLQEFTDAVVTLLTDEEVNLSVHLGLVRIYELEI